MGATVDTQANTLLEHEESLKGLYGHMTSVDGSVAMVQTTLETFQASVSSDSTSRGVKAEKPKRFSGKASELRDWLFQVE